MRTICFSIFALLCPMLTHASDYEGFKEFFEQGRAPRRIDEVEAYLKAAPLTCLGFDKTNRSHSDVPLVQTLTLRAARGPAFPAETKKVILLGKPEWMVYSQLNYGQELTASELKLTTMRTRSREVCEDIDDLDFCSTEYDRVVDLKLRVRFNGQYLTYSDDTHGVFAYCW